MTSPLCELPDTPAARALLAQAVGDDPWVSALLDETGDDDRPASGRVLRAKLGYNPNSSSVGSVITVLLWGATVGAAVMNVLAARVARPAAEDAPEREA